MIFKEKKSAFVLSNVLFICIVRRPGIMRRYQCLHMYDYFFLRKKKKNEEEERKEKKRKEKTIKQRRKGLVVIDSLATKGLEKPSFL